MNREAAVGVAALCLLLTAGCSSSQTPLAKARPGAPVHTFAGGCAGTVLIDAEPPQWSQGGWTAAKGSPWPVPWAIGAHGNAAAFMFSTELVAGGSPRVDGSNNKVLWVAKGNPANFVVQGALWASRSRSSAWRAARASWMCPRQDAGRSACSGVRPIGLAPASSTSRPSRSGRSQRSGWRSRGTDGGPGAPG